MSRSWSIRCVRTSIGGPSGDSPCSVRCGWRSRTIRKDRSSSSRRSTIPKTRCRLRKIPFSRVLYIEADDFMQDPPKKFFRLSPGNEVRLRYAYILKCERVITDPAGAPIELKCTIDTESLNGATATRRVKGTLHWVSAAHAVDAEVRLYDRLFRSEDPGEGGRDPLTDLNPESLTVLTGCKVESMLAGALPARDFSSSGRAISASTPIRNRRAPVFNRTVTLKDTWAKISGKAGK